mgnify:CR=1 FL=1
MVYILNYNANSGYTCLPLDKLREKVSAYLQIAVADFDAAYAEFAGRTRHLRL